MLTLIAIFAVMVGVSHQATVPASLGAVLRIAGGKPISIEKAPFVAALMGNTSSARYLCTAAIVSDKFLVTLADCARGIVTATVGIDKVTSNGTDYEIEKVVKHPDNGKKSVVDNDIAVIKLKKSIVFNDKVKQIPMIDANADIKGGQTVNILGFGVDLQNDFGTLRSVDVPVIERGDCNEKLSGFGINVTESMICAGGEPKKGACNRDFGGPLVYNGTLAGLMIGCSSRCGDGFPALYSNVGYLRKWVDDTITKLT